MVANGPEIRFLSVDQVIDLHDATQAKHGGLAGIRDVGLLDAAVAMPRQRFGGAFLHDGLPAMAGAYLFHLCRNHPFNDGNKRVGAMAALVFLRVNGVKRLPEPDDLERVTLAVAAGQMGKDQCIAWFEQIAGEATD